MKRLLLAALILLFTQFGYGQNIVKTADNTYQVRILMGNFHLQRMNNYSQNDDDEIRSWAACVQMALDYGGATAVSQEQILTTAFGTTTDMIGGPQELMAATSSFKPTVFGQRANIFCEIATVNEDALFDELSNNRPLIVGLHNINNFGTGKIILAMTYSIKFNAAGEQTGIIPTSVTIGDPWPTTSGIKTITWADFMKNANTLYTLKISIGK